MQGIRTQQQPNSSNQIQPTMIQNPMSQMAMKRQPSGSASNSIEGQPGNQEAENQYTQIQGRKGPLGQRSGSMPQAVAPSSDYNQFTHSAERTQVETGDQKMPGHPSQTYAQNQLVANQRRNSASQIQMANEKVQSTPQNLYDATKQSTQGAGLAQSVTRLHDKAKIQIPASSGLKLKNLANTPTGSLNQPKTGAGIIQFGVNNKMPSRGQSSGDHANQQVKAPQAQPMNSTQNFRSPSQLNMNPSKAKINVKLSKKSNASGSLGKNQYGVVNMAQTLGGQPQGQKKGNWANSLSQYNSGSSMAKTFDKKSSLKLMAASNLTNPKKSMNSSNPSLNQESFKEAPPAKKAKIQLKNKNLQQSPLNARNDHGPIEQEQMALRANDAYGAETFNPNSSDYYRTTKRDDGEANVPKHPFSQSPSRGGLSKIGGGSGSALSLKSKVHPLQKATFKSLGMFEQGKDPKKKAFASLNSSKSKFGQPKNSVKPPTKKTQFLPMQSYNPQLHQGAKIKQSHSSLQVSSNSEYVQRQKSNSIVQSGHQQLIQSQSQEGQLSTNVYSQLSDRIKRKSNHLIQGSSPASAKQGKKGSKSALGQAANAVRASSQLHPKESAERVAKKNGQRNAAQSQDRPTSLVSASSKNFSSQERVLRMAAEEQEKLDEMIAQNQQRNIDMEKKRQGATQMNKAQKNMQALSSKAGIMASKVGTKKSGQQSPMNQNTQMINLNNIQKAQKERSGNHIAKMSASPQQMVGGIDQMQHFQKMQNNQRHSPIDMPSSSNTSKQSNGTQTGNSNSFGSKNQFPPEARQIGHQFTEIVKCLQNIEEQASGSAQNRAEQSPDPIAPQISNIIAKLYSVKSAYEQTISNMARQNHAGQIQLHQQTYVGQQQKQAQENAPSQYNKLTPHGANEDNPPLSASTRSRGHAFLAGTGGSNNKCRHCKGNGYAPSSNSASERQTYAGVSARVENANDQQLQLISQNSGREADPLRGGKSVQQPLTKAIGGAELVTINLEADPYKHQESQEVAGAAITKSLSASSAKNRMKSEKSDSFRKVFQQIQKLTEDNKKISQLEEQYSQLKTSASEKDRMLASVEKKLAAAQGQVAQQLSEQKLLRAQLKDLEGQLAQKKLTSKGDSSASKTRLAKFSQTDDELLTEKEITLLVDIKKLERKLKKVEKDKVYNQNKISKFIYFFFTLQNKGIPVNEIYEKDGVKFIKTDRFQEIMAQNGQSPGEGAAEAEEEKVKEEDEISFYSDDSFEYCPFKPELAKQSRFKNLNLIHIPSLDFEGLPEYETTDDEEEGEDQEGQEHPQSQSQLELLQEQQFEQLGINSPTPHNRLNQFDNSQNGLNQVPIKGSAADIVPKGSSSKKVMNQKDYQKSMQYIEKFYQQQDKQAQDSPNENNSGVMFDDAPQSVTENSSIFENESKVKTRKMSKQPKRNSPNPDEILGGINQNFDKSDKFDESMMSYQSREMKMYRKSQIGMGMKDTMDVLGVSIDSQSFDQSLIDQSMNSGKKKMRRSKKKKEDLDGSKLYRENKDGRGSNLDSNQQSSQGKQSSKQSPPQPKPKKKNVSPVKQKQSLGAVVNQKGRLLDSKFGKKQNNRSNSRGGQSISSGNASAQLEGGQYF